MSTPRTITYEYEADPDAVAMLLRDPEFLRRRCAAAGESNVEVTVEDTPEGVRVVVARDKATSLPALARRWAKPVQRIVDSTTWTREGEGWVGEYSVEIRGVPGEVRGQSRLAPMARGCRYVSRFEVTAHVPVFASKLEEIVADRIEETMKASAARNAERLRS